MLEHKVRHAAEPYLSFAQRSTRHRPLCQRHAGARGDALQESIRPPNKNGEGAGEQQPARIDCLQLGLAAHRSQQVEVERRCLVRDDKHVAGRVRAVQLLAT